MKFTEQRAAIETKFTSGWDSTKTPIKFDNAVGLVKGTSTLKDESKLDEWCFIRIENTTADYGQLGMKMIRHTGLIFVTVFTKLATGTNRARELADKVAEVMRQTSSDVIVYSPAQVVASFQSPDAPFYQMSVEIPFMVDQHI